MDILHDAVFEKQKRLAFLPWGYSMLFNQSFNVKPVLQNMYFFASLQQEIGDMVIQCK